MPQTYKPPQTNIIMQRKAVLAHSTLGIVILMVAILLILLGLTRVGSGKLNQAGNGAVGMFEDMFSMCENLGVVSFDNFMTAMKTTYDDCKTKNICDAASCKKMILDEGTLGDYYQVGYNELKTYELEDFIGSDLLKYTRMLCGGDDLFCGSSEIDIYHKPEENFKTNSMFILVPPNDAVSIRETTSNHIVCSYWKLRGITSPIAADGGFYVANGAKIKITAKKISGTLLCAGDNIDIKVIVDGGSYTTQKQP